MSGSVDEETSGITESVDGETGGNYVDSDVDDEVSVEDSIDICSD